MSAIKEDITAKRNFVTDFIAGAVIFGMACTLAADLFATPNAFPITFDGNSANIEGYNILNLSISTFLSNSNLISSSPSPILMR